MAQGDDDRYDFSGSGSEDRTAVVDLTELSAARREQKPDRHLLVGVHGSLLGQVIRLDEQPFRVGRNHESELWLDDTGVSRRHAQIVPDPGGYLLEDLESANGTFVQGQRVDRHLLRDGDVIQFGPTAVFRYSLADKDQEDMLRQLYAASVTDPLTGAHNREYFDTHLASELSYARRHKTDLGLLMFDIDHFKRVNDTYGHQAGDTVLIEIANMVAKIVRNEDVIARYSNPYRNASEVVRKEEVFARYGGEEFAMILRETDVGGTQRAGERLRQTIEAMFIQAESNRIRVTISVGCASLAECTEPQAEQLIALADRRLYAAKHAGRNRVVAEG
jgi:GGDEF domain-containing protein